MDVMERSVTQAELIDLHERLSKANDGLSKFVEINGSSDCARFVPVDDVMSALCHLIGWYAVNVKPNHSGFPMPSRN